MNRDYLEVIFKHLKDAVIAIDARMCVVEANEAVQTVCGLRPQEIIGKRITEIDNPCSRSCQKILVETLRRKKVFEEHRIECGRINRPRQTVSLTSLPLVDRQNGFMGAVLVARSIGMPSDEEHSLAGRVRFHNIIGRSKPMQAIYGLLENLATTDTTVLITGESGTGKELLAEAIHYRSTRAARPLVKVNCSGLPETLLESELFGHVKGAFTGAVSDREGRFQSAHGGTIFLDEIGEITPIIRLRLLRVLEERKFERVGESKSTTVDVRIIAATNRDLIEQVRLGEFREDLYYRVKVVEVALPPLRDRREDIPLLNEHFCRLFNQSFRKAISGVSEEVLARFMQYPWPGNVRELKHALEHAFVFCRGQTIMLRDLPPEIRESSRSGRTAPIRRPLVGRQEIVRALEETGWNKAKAARFLNISRQTIYRKIQEYKLTRARELM
jgi:PAS domain S-box-containing protein